MRLFYLSIFLLFLVACTNNNSVYWCGDHACANIEEKESYFKKTMIVEIKNKKKVFERKSNFEKVMNQIDLEDNSRKINNKDATQIVQIEATDQTKEEKRLAKQARIEKLRQIKIKEKLLKKQARIEKLKQIKEEKRLAKEEKRLAKQIEKDEKKMVKKIEIQERKQKKLKKTNEKKPINNIKEISSNINEKSSFSKIVQQIRLKNSFRSFPDINNIPN